MVDTDPESEDAESGVSRRRFVQAAGATSAAMGVAGCVGGDDEDEGDDPIQLTADADVADAQEEIQEALYEAGLDEEIEVEILPGDFETDSRRAEFTQALDAGRSSPDIFLMDSGWTIPFIVRDQLVNLSENLSDETLDYVENDYLGAAVATATHPETGDLFGLPAYPGYPTMQYRKDLVEEAGYDPDGENWATEPMSWQEFAEMAADVWEQHGGEEEFTYGFVTQADAYEGLACCTFNETMTSFGGAYFGDHENLFGPVGDRPITVNEEPLYETIRMMRSFMYGPDEEDTHPDYPQITNSDLVQFTEEDAREPFTNGNALFLRNWPYSIAINGDEEEFGEDLGVMPLPYGVEDGEGQYEGTGGTSHALGGWHLTVNPNSQREDEALQVLEAFSSEEVMLTIFEEVGNLPPDPSVTQQADEETVGAVGRYLDTLAVAGENTVPRPVTDIWPEQSSMVYQEVHDAYQGNKSPEEAMSELESQLEDSEQE